MRFHVTGMLKSLVLFILVIQFGQTQTQAHANSLCASLFDSAKTQSTKSTVQKFETPALLPFTSELSLEKLRSQNFKVDKEGVLWDTSKPTHRKIGLLKVIDTNKVYQWASQRYHQDIIEAGGITKGWMKSILGAGPQAAGVGFYVSTHPFDSASYGTAVTVFDLRRPLVLLESGLVHEGYPFALDTISSESFALRAQAAGIDGFRTHGYQESWISVINSQVLSKPRALNPEDLAPFLQYGVSLSYNGYLKRSLSFLRDQLTDSDIERPFYKVLRKKNLNSSEIAHLLQHYSNYAEENRLHIYNELKNNLLQTGSLDEIKKIFQILIEKPGSDAFTDEFVNGIYPKNINKNLNLKMSLLDIFDIRTVSQLSDVADQNEKMHLLHQYFSAAEIYEGHLNSNFHGIKTPAELLAFSKQIYGDVQFKTRDIDVAMAFDAYGRIAELPLSDIAFKRISKNPNLQVRLIRTERAANGEKLKIVEVTYASPEQYSKMFDLGPDAKNWTSKKIIAESTKRLLTALLNPYQKRHLVKDFPHSLFERYSLFLSLHPLEDGNGRFSRLLYLVLGNTQNMARTQRGLTFPIYDLDLFLDHSEVQPQIKIGAMMKLWVAASNSPEMFIDRSKQAVAILKELYPHLSSLIE